MSTLHSNSNETAPVYGFLCEETNVFYAFDTFEEYQEFLTWLQRTSTSQPSSKGEETMTDEELRINSERVT